MQLAALSRTAKTVYGVFAGLIWVVWMGIAVYGDVQRVKGPAEGSREVGAASGENKE